MKISLLTSMTLAASLFLGGAATPNAASAGKTAPKTSAPAPATTPVTNLVAVIPQSLFTVPQSPREGCNPFFPQAKTVAAAPKPKAQSKVVSFVLNGITSPPRRTAMINGRTFEPGESGEIRLSDGNRITITCAEVRDDCAIITVAGERREIRFKTGI